nr:Hypothetical protein [Lactiplantibacillus plantarum]
MRTYTPQLKLMVFVLNFLYQKSASRQQKKVLELSTHFLFTKPLADRWASSIKITIRLLEARPDLMALSKPCTVIK